MVSVLFYVLGGVEREGDEPMRVYKKTTVCDKRVQLQTADDLKYRNVFKCSKSPS